MTSTAALQRALDRAVRDRDRYLEERNERILALHELDAVKAENERLQTQTITATAEQLRTIAHIILGGPHGALVEVTNVNNNERYEKALKEITTAAHVETAARLARQALAAEEQEGDLYVVQGDARTLVGRDGDVRTVTP